MKKKKGEKASTVPILSGEASTVLISPRPTIAELEAILNKEEESPIQILPNGEVRSVPGSERKKNTPVTFRETLGGEYAA